MRAKEFIIESLSKAYPLQLVESTPDTLTWVFVTDDGKGGECQFWQKVEGGPWDFAFSVAGNIHLTNQGDAFKILATVIESMKLFMNTPQGAAMQELHVDAKTLEASRVSLYQKLAQSAERLGLQYEGSRSTGQYTTLIFVNKNNPPEAKKPEHDWKNDPDWELIEHVTFYDMHKEAFEYAENYKRSITEEVDESIFDVLRDVDSAPPIVGQSYYYLSVYVLPATKIISTAEFREPHRLTAIQGKNLTFKINGKDSTYPRPDEYIKGDSRLFVYTFEEESDIKQCLMFLTLKYENVDGWKIIDKTLD